MVETGKGGIHALKVPLASTYETAYEEGCVFSVTMFVERVQRSKRRLALALDATMGSANVSFHDVEEWEDWDVERTALVRSLLYGIH